MKELLQAQIEASEDYEAQLAEKLEAIEKVL